MKNLPGISPLGQELNRRDRRMAFCLLIQSLDQRGPARPLYFLFLAGQWGWGAEAVNEANSFLPGSHGPMWSLEGSYLHRSTRDHLLYSLGLSAAPQLGAAALSGYPHGPG